MRPALRLATSNAFRRRSHTLLLVGAVGLSAALISGVSAALHSLNASIGERTRETLGTADLRIQPTGAGQTLDEALLAEVRQWPEVRLATARLDATIPTLAVEKPVLAAARGGAFRARTEILASTALAHGVDPELEPAFRPIRLLAGRQVAAPGEIVVDALLAQRLSWQWQQDPDRRYGFGVAQRRAVLEQLRPLEVPPRVEGRARAERLNARQGVRVGDELSVVARAIPLGGPADLAGVLLGPLRSVHLVRLFGGAEGIANLTTLAADPRARRAQAAMLRDPATVRVVGVAEQPPLGGRPQAYLELATLQEVADLPGRVSGIDIILHEGHAPQQVAASRQEALGRRLIIQTTERITSGLETNLRGSQLGFVLASMLAFLSAAFIIMTGMTTDVAQRRRELAILRCVGASRGQVARAQLAHGAMVGGAGAVAGAPLGLAVAWAIAESFPEQLPGGLAVSRWGVALAAGGALLAGVAGAAAPAWQAAQTAPLRAMTRRAQPARARGVVLTAAAGIVLAAVHLAIAFFTPDAQVAFWLYATFGLPALFAGWFLLGVPMTALAARSVAPGLSRVLRLPRGVLGRTLSGLPYRYGFTAGALMTGLALLTAIWTNGNAILRDWIDAMEFPDAFVSGFPLREGAREALEALAFVENSAAITREVVRVGGEAQLGVRGLQRYDTSFLGFEPEPFFEMTELTWVQGSQESALPRLLEAPDPDGEINGAILVAREFLTARGKGVGDTFTIEHLGREYTFEIVGVVTSPGLDIASRFFNIGEEYAQQAVHAVFGNMRIVRELLGSDRTHIIQIDLAADVDDGEAIEVIRQRLAPYGLLDAGSGRQIKRRIAEFATGTLMVFSAVAVVALLVACFGVANLIVAGIELRRHEFGVLRAVGAGRLLLVRLVLAEAAVVAIVAAVLGTAMGLQAALGGRRMYELLLGIEFELRPPLLPISLGWVVLIALALLAAGPAAARLNRRTARELLQVGA